MQPFVREEEEEEEQESVERREKSVGDTRKVNNCQRPPRLGEREGGRSF